MSQEEEEGTGEAARVFCGFLSGRSDLARDESQDSSKAEFQVAKSSKATEIGRQLAKLSMKLDAEHSNILDTLVQEIIGTYSRDTIFDKFKFMVRKILTPGKRDD